MIERGREMEMEMEKRKERGEKREEKITIQTAEMRQTLERVTSQMHLHKIFSNIKHVRNITAICLLVFIFQFIQFDAVVVSVIVSSKLNCN